MGKCQWDTETLREGLFFFLALYVYIPCKQHLFSFLVDCGPEIVSYNPKEGQVNVSLCQAMLIK